MSGRRKAVPLSFSPTNAGVSIVARNCAFCSDSHLSLWNVLAGYVPGQLNRFIVTCPAATGWNKHGWFKWIFPNHETAVYANEVFARAHRAALKRSLDRVRAEPRQRARRARSQVETNQPVISAVPSPRGWSVPPKPGPEVRSADNIRRRALELIVECGATSVFVPPVVERQWNRDEVCEDGDYGLPLDASLRWDVRDEHPDTRWFRAWHDPLEDDERPATRGIEHVLLVPRAAKRRRGPRVVIGERMCACGRKFTPHPKSRAGRWCSRSCWITHYNKRRVTFMAATRKARS